MQRHKGSNGSFSPNKFATRRDAEGRKLHEISLNPATFEGRTDREIASTLVHEEHHCWPEEHDKPGRRRYHNKDWAEKMESNGLMPSSTGKPGGKRTAQKVSHYIIDGDRFDEVWARLEATGFHFDYQDRPTNPEAASRSRPISATIAASEPGARAISLQTSRGRRHLGLSGLPWPRLGLRGCGGASRQILGRSRRLRQSLSPATLMGANAPAAAAVKLIHEVKPEEHKTSTEKLRGILDNIMRFRHESAAAQSA